MKHLRENGGGGGRIRATSGRWGRTAEGLSVGWWEAFKGLDYSVWVGRIVLEIK